MSTALIPSDRLTKKAFDVCYNRLAKATKTADVDQYTKQIYFDALADLPLWAVEGAELQLRRRPGAFFPSSGDWHAVATELIAVRRREIALTPATPDYECAVCRDRGWVDELRDGHEVCIPCSCRPWNTNYQRMTHGR